jgi:hypothetical protein
MLLLRERVQAFQQRFREACALGDGQLQRFGFQVGEVHGKHCTAPIGGCPAPAAVGEEAAASHASGLAGHADRAHRGLERRRRPLTGRSRRRSGSLCLSAQRRGAHPRGALPSEARLGAPSGAPACWAVLGSRGTVSLNRSQRSSSSPTLGRSWPRFRSHVSGMPLIPCSAPARAPAMAQMESTSPPRRAAPVIAAEYVALFARNAQSAAKTDSLASGLVPSDRPASMGSATLSRSAASSVSAASTQGGVVTLPRRAVGKNLKRQLHAAPKSARRLVVDGKSSQQVLGIHGSHRDDRLGYSDVHRPVVGIRPRARRRGARDDPMVDDTTSAQRLAMSRGPPRAVGSIASLGGMLSRSDFQCGSSVSIPSRGLG